MTPPSTRDAYIELIKRAATNYLYLGEKSAFEHFRSATHYDLSKGEWKIDPLAKPATLLTKPQLDLVEQAVLSVIDRGVPGDFLEAGIWRGGTIILLRALIEAHALPDRKVFAADSFAGIPVNTWAKDDPVDLWPDRWVAGLEEVRENIARFGLLDDKIRFVPGFFADTLHTLAGERFALIRLDSDSYDSVETSFDHLYPRVSQGGIVIVDDWHLAGCRMAVLNYRQHHGIAEPIQEYEGNAYWVKQQPLGQPSER